MPASVSRDQPEFTFMLKSKSSLVTRVLSWKSIVAVLAVVALGVAGCASLEVKEREMTFRVVRSTASWYTGMPKGVEELHLAVSAEGEPQQIHAWAAEVRAVIATMQELAAESRDKEHALEHLLRRLQPDPAAIDALVLEIAALRIQIESMIAALPALD